MQTEFSLDQLVQPFWVSKQPFCWHDFCQSWCEGQDRFDDRPSICRVWVEIVNLSNRGFRTTSFLCDIRYTIIQVVNQNFNLPVKVRLLRMFNSPKFWFNGTPIYSSSLLTECSLTFHHSHRPANRLVGCIHESVPFLCCNQYIPLFSSYRTAKLICLYDLISPLRPFTWFCWTWSAYCLPDPRNTISQFRNQNLSSWLDWLVACDFFLGRKRHDKQTKKISFLEDPKSAPFRHICKAWNMTGTSKLSRSPFL